MDGENAHMNIIDVTPDKDGGVIKEIRRQGEGTETPYLGDQVTVHYIGTLTDGTQFDSSRDRGEKFEFSLGKGNVIKAWDLGVATMKRGELCTLTCQPQYAYGENGSPPKIGKNATLKFEVELFDWKGEDISTEKDGSVIRHQIKMGDGYQTPNEGAVVKIHVTGRCQGKLFEARDVEFSIGDGAAAGIVAGVEQGLRKFKRGEHSRLEVRACEAYGSEGNDALDIPPHADLEYDIVLNTFEKGKESWEMDSNEKLEQSRISKAKGTAFFKVEKYELAITQYKKVVSFLEDETRLKDGEKAERDDLFLAAHLNLAMCYLRQGDYKETRDSCDRALEIDACSVKALYRRAQAYDKVNDYDLAIKDYESILVTEPDNKAAARQLGLSRQKLSKFLGDQKKRYEGMFTKFAAADEKNPKTEDHADEGMESDNEENGEKSNDDAEYSSSDAQAETQVTNN